MKSKIILLALICASTVFGAQPESQPVWTEDTTKLYDNLKASGFPDNIIFAILVAKDKKEMDPQRIALFYPNGLTRYATPSRKVSGGQVNDLYDAGRLRIRLLMGPSMDATIARLDSVQMFRWGNLTDDEVVAVKRVYEYLDSAMAHKHPYNGALDKRTFTWDEKLSEEFDLRIRRILGNKADDFLTFNSFQARKVATEIGNSEVAVDEAAFRKLVAETGKLRKELAPAILNMTTNQCNVRKCRMYQFVLGGEKGLAVMKANTPPAEFSEMVLSL